MYTDIDMDRALIECLCTPAHIHRTCQSFNRHNCFTEPTCYRRYTNRYIYMCQCPYVPEWNACTWGYFHKERRTTLLLAYVNGLVFVQHTNECLSTKDLIECFGCGIDDERRVFVFVWTLNDVWHPYVPEGGFNVLKCCCSISSFHSQVAWSSHVERTSSARGRCRIHSNKNHLQRPGAISLPLCVRSHNMYKYTICAFDCHMPHGK